MGFFESNNANAKERILLEYFRDDFTYVSKAVDVEDSCAFLKKGGDIVKGWGVSPSVVFPVEGKYGMAIIVNERDGNPNDPYNRLNPKDKFTQSFIKQKAQDQENKVNQKKVVSLVERGAMLIFGVGAFEFVIAGIMFFMKYYERYKL